MGKCWVDLRLSHRPGLFVTDPQVTAIPDPHAVTLLSLPPPPAAVLAHPPVLHAVRPLRLPAIPDSYNVTLLSSSPSPSLLLQYWLNPLSYTLYGLCASQLGDVYEMLNPNPLDPTGPMMTVADFIKTQYGFECVGRGVWVDGGGGGAGGYPQPRASVPWQH